MAEIEGTYALGVVHKTRPERLIAARKGSPLVIGVGIGEHFIASDIFALLPVTRQFIILEEGDLAEVFRDRVTVFDPDGNRVERAPVTSEISPDSTDKAGYRHYMAKEIFSQPVAIADTLEGRIENGSSDRVRVRHGSGRPARAAWRIFISSPAAAATMRA